MSPSELRKRMTSKIHVTDIVNFLMSQRVLYNDAFNAWKIATLHGTVAVSVNGLITYEFAETYDGDRITGFDVRVQNALV